MPIIKPTKKITPKPLSSRKTKTAAAAVTPPISPATPPQPPTSPLVASGATDKPTLKKHVGWRKILKIASPLVILISLYFVVYPFWPRIQYALFPPTTDNAAATTTNNANTEQPPKVLNKVAPGNKIIIPKIGVDMPVVEGTNEKTALNQGAWRMPQTSMPDLGGNTVITAHRFKYRPPSKETFYLLDKLVVGDEFTIHWNELEYKYRVTETKIVEPTALEVLNNTSSPRVTLITCTPLFTTKQRLIVIGKPI